LIPCTTTSSEELPDDVRFFDSNEEYDSLDGELDTSQDTIIELYLEVASYFYDTGKFGDAIATYASAISRDDECAPAWYGLARCYAQTSEFAKAITAVEKAIFLHPQYQTQAGSDTAFYELKPLPRFKAVVGEGE
jgi:tetratricopeptide (TPR) repeat protein